MTDFSLKHPWIIMILVLAATVFFGAQFPKVHFDNDPENMLSEDEFVRIFHHQTKEKYALYDFVIVGIVNEDHPDGIFNVQTLTRVNDLTSQILSLRRNENGLPEVVTDGTETEWMALDLRSDSAFRRAMAVAFRHDPNHLFDEDGDSAIIAREVISASVVDNIKQSDLGSLKIAYLMENVPKTREEALIIRDDAMNNPLYNGTLVAEDEKAICIYIPIAEKTYSYNVASLVRELTKDWKGDDKVYITGLPVAEDTFGIEMLVQMAISAPLAMLILFILMYVFFRRVSLIIAPMLLAVITVIWTMGLLIGLGFDVHIMSSMIPIFIMPITICNSIHLLSEFFDSYHKHNDKAKTLRHVVQELFMPMFYTTLTTIAGFASLATTPIPPVRVFGLHIAFGVAVGWLLTMTLVPASIMLFVPKRALLGISGAKEKSKRSGLSRFLMPLGAFTYRRPQLVVWASIIVLAFSVYGITLINVNDNPVKWFTEEHPIRAADTVLNSHFGGTYTAYLTLSAVRPESYNCLEKAAIIRKEAEKRFGAALPDATMAYLRKLDELKQLYRNARSSDVKKCFVELVNTAEQIDKTAGASWNKIADEVNYLDPDGLTHEKLLAAIRGIDQVDEADRQTMISRLDGFKEVQGDSLLNKALSVCDEFTQMSFRDFTFEMEAELTAPLFKQPEMLRYVEGLQKDLARNEAVGKSSSAADALKKASYELQYVAPPSDATDEENEAFAKRNQSNFAVSGSASAAGQVFTQLEGMKKKDTLFHLVTKDYQEANIWVQLKNGDNQDMVTVVEDVRNYVDTHKPPVDLNVGWAGLTYLNVVWQDKMVKGMMLSLVSSFVVVLVMMLILFRSGLFGVLAMIPLTVTITLIYGLIGWVGKDYDMPVAILSAMTLGLSVDFAIHFLERSREMYKKTGNWKEGNTRMFDEPAKAISRNAIVIAFGFLPLLLAPLVPYRTVGFFLAMIMIVSWLTTLLILPALMRLMEKWLFRRISE